MLGTSLNAVMRNSECGSVLVIVIRLVATAMYDERIHDQVFSRAAGKLKNINGLVEDGSPHIEGYDRGMWTGTCLNGQYNGLAIDEADVCATCNSAFLFQLTTDATVRLRQTFKFRSSVQVGLQVCCYAKAV
jgi:hypothetical protein